MRYEGCVDKDVYLSHGSHCVVHVFWWVTPNKFFITTSPSITVYGSLTIDHMGHLIFHGEVFVSRVVLWKCLVFMALAQYKTIIAQCCVYW